MAKQALDGKRLNAFALDPEDLTIIGLDTDDGPEHPDYDRRVRLPLSDEFVGNIRALGVLEPVLVRKDGERVIVIAGRQRVRAARAVKASGTEILVRCMLQHGDSATVKIAENEARVQDTIDVRIEKLVHYLALGHSERDAATAFCVSMVTIKGWLAIANAAPEVRKAVKTGALSANEAKKIARKPRGEQVKALAAPKVAKTKADVVRAIEILSGVLERPIACYDTWKAVREALVALGIPREEQP